MYHIIGIEPQFENIISNGPFIPMAAGQKNPKAQWTADERKPANLDQCLKSLIMYMLPDDQMNSVTRSSHEYLNDLEEEYQARDLLAKSKRFFKKDTQWFSSAKAIDQTECHKCGKKGHFARDCKNKGLIAKTYDWDDEEVSSDENEVTGVKALMALTDEERVSVGKESDRNGVWTKISMKKVHILLEMEDNDDRKSFLDYLYNSDMSITSSNIPKSSKTKDSNLPNQDTDEKLDSAEPVYGPKTIKSILKSKSTFKADTLKCIIINEPSSTPTRGKSSSASKTNSTPTGKLKNVKMEDDPSLAIVMKELNELKLQISKKKSSYSRNKNAQQVPSNALQNRYKTQFKMNCDLCRQNNHLSKNCYEVLFCKECKRTNHKTCDHAEFMSSMNANQHHIGQGESSSRSRPSRPSVSFPSCIHYGYNDHHSNECAYYPTCEICRSYDHDTYGNNRIISLRRGINPRNPQHVTKNCETCGSNVHTTSDHNDIEWFRKRETLQAKNAESFKASKNDSSSALRSKTPTKSEYSNGVPLNKLGPDLNGKAICDSVQRYLSVAKKASLADKVAIFSAETEDIAAAGCCANILWT
ncbi:retrovirus-related pol polyprotein from transposon TNT 1-94 [Tanacetum coccineum]|uniref:Retrovirus-related pol polyprotein from transposon TNT 1-94 n=1 Tax=Tanacetum coccineum TaxID=301880 RepID=A0ABQ5EAG0_9ASTR